MSFAPVVRTGSDPKWYGNALRFETREEALANAKDLMGRWMLVTDCGAEESLEPVTNRWVDGRLVDVKDADANEAQLRG